jgi:hypothetical protein
MPANGEPKQRHRFVRRMHVDEYHVDGKGQYKAR